MHADALRLVHDAVTAVAPGARVYLSLEHHWGVRYGAGDATQSVPWRALLERVATLARAGGDFPWHVAYHPYPEDLFDPRVWEDATALPRDDTPRITFRNLEVLTTFLARPELRFEGAPRRVILSEQGFHCPDGEDGPRDQAAGFAWAWRKTAALDGVDALILHRHVDHAAEGGLRLGLWTRAEGTTCTPAARRPLWALLRDCDGPDGPAAVDAALAAAGSPPP